MTKWLAIGIDQALQITLDTIMPLGNETVQVISSAGRIAGCDLCAEVDSPSIDASLKDGYAVKSVDIENASPDNPVRLSFAGSAAAGDGREQSLKNGEAIRILTGAEIPAGADAVLAEEFVDWPVISEKKIGCPVVREDNCNSSTTALEGSTEEIPSFIYALNCAEPGRNIMPKATDVAKGQVLVSRNQQISSGYAGLLAAAGVNNISVFRQPRVSLIATGDEIVAPGQPLPRGKLYASNMVTLASLCKYYGMQTSLMTAKDSAKAICSAIEKSLGCSDALITSGGAWTGDRDLVATVLSDMGWQQHFHRIRIGPGKAVGFGILEGKPVFILPGGPPSNLMGFLQIALPGLLKLAGYSHPGLQRRSVKLASDLHGRDSGWTQFIFGVLERPKNDVLIQSIFRPLHQKGRLQTMAEANAVAAIPEGKTLIKEGSVIQVQLLP
ncbi:Molybdopterin biosynthesis MoeA protein [Desulfamplus magnetovallimortis]|uniref:Molybdopterin molybdenumtransferase n=1 Tax=Desulfamplus magnetovallimortis TaxID=1246637 RepID=A0A1W1HJN1_9BACT|nr:molybdopterin molybdotransferase MoeA [Desulfamplus magnetovallimortis]SLM32582.1 Molybdopterin biosynthesis MoeA protein [Desulfamplus magnetovallimortis]